MCLFGVKDCCLLQGYLTSEAHPCVATQRALWLEKTYERAHRTTSRADLKDTGFDCLRFSMRARALRGGWSVLLVIKKFLVRFNSAVAHFFCCFEEVVFEFGVLVWKLSFFDAFLQSYLFWGGWNFVFWDKNPSVIWFGLKRTKYKILQ